MDDRDERRHVRARSLQSDPVAQADVFVSLEVMVRVEDAMTSDVVSCHAESSLAVAGQRMAERRCGVLPVVDKHGKVVGVITDRDIAMAAVTRHRNADNILVYEKMSQQLHGCHPGDHVSNALAKMVEASVRRLPVLDDDGRLVGLLSIEDLALRAVGQEGGVDVGDFFASYQSLCRRPAVEPAYDASDSMTPG